MADESHNRQADGPTGGSAPENRSSGKPKPRRKRSRKKKPANDLGLAQVDLKEQLKDKSEQLRERDRELKQLRRQYERVETQLDKKNAQLDERTRTLRQREQKVQAATTNLEELQETHDRLSREYEELKQEHETALHVFQERAAEYELAKGQMTEMLAGRLTEQRETLEAEYARAIERLKEELAAETQREQELSERIERMEHERDEAKEALFEARQQLEEHRHAFEAVRSRFAEDQQEREQLQGEIEQLREVLSQATIGVAGDLSEKFETQSAGATSRIMGVAAVLVLVAVSIGLGLFTWAQGGTGTERMVGTLVVPGGDARLMQRCTEEARQAPEGIGVAGVAIEPVEQRGVVQVAVDLQRVRGDADAARERIDTLGRYVARQMRYFTPGAEDADVVDAFEVAAAGIRHELDRLGDASAAPGASAAATAELDKLERFGAAYDQRRRLASELAEAEAAVEALAAPVEDVQVGEAPIAEARRSDRMLLADMAELQRREAELRGSLVSMLSGAEEDFAALDREIDAGVQYAEGLKSRDYGDEVDGHLDTLIAALTRWKDAAETLEQTWNAELQALSSAGDVDVLAVHEQLAEAVRTFTGEIRRGMQDYDRAVGQLDQGGEQPSTRVVLKRNIELRLGTAVRACDPLIANARSLLLENDRSLQALVASISGLRRRVAAREAEIVEVLEQELLAEREARRATERETATAQRDRLREQMAQLDRQMDESPVDPDALRALVAGSHEGDDRQLDALDRHVAALNATIEQLRAARTAPVATHVTYVPAEVVARPLSGAQRTRQAVVVGAIPMAGAILLLVMMAVVRAYQRGEDSIREVADALHSATAPPAATDAPNAEQ